MPDKSEGDPYAFNHGSVNSHQRGAANRTASISNRTHCKHGHEYTEENIKWRTERGKQVRSCKQCYEDRVIAKRIGTRIEPNA